MVFEIPCDDCGMTVDIYWDLGDSCLCPKCWFERKDREMRD